MIAAILIVSTALYLVGGLFWAAFWAGTWVADNDTGTNSTQAARNVLAAPIWPLPALKAAARLYAKLRRDARGHE